MTDRVLAIDGGNSKTAVLLVDADGRVLAQVRGPGAPPQTVGMKRGLDVFEGLAREAAALAGLSPDEPIASHTAAFLAGADLPREEEDLTREITKRGWSTTTFVGNDTFALLRAGTNSGVGVAVVCDGSMPAESTVLTTLATLGERIAAQGVRAPDIIVVGEVVRVAHPEHFPRVDG